MATYYLDGTTLTNSTSVFDDADLTTCAADGFYSDGVVSRQLLNCVLLPAQTCGTCAQPCDGTIAASGDQGVFIVDIDLGGTSTDTGAAIVTFNPASIPDGIIVTYDSSSYNKLVSATEGVLQANNAGVPDLTVPTFVGRIGSQTNCNGGTPGAIEGTYTLNEDEYIGGAFVPTGNQQIITITPTGNQLTTNAPNNCMMVIPKPTPSPSIMQVQVYGPCGSTGWNIGVQCPTALTSFQGSTTTGDLQCNLNPSQSYYHVPINGTATNPALYDMIFIDENGVTPASDGFINLVGEPHPWIQIQNGVVINTGTCVPNGYRLQECCDGDVWTASNSTYGGFSVGDVVQFKEGATGSGGEKCATVQALINSATFDSIIQSGVAYACDDTVHCPPCP
jgi:hypothetical protein|tara:strand:+ start:906 stop:2081 length:1176 start_codon:yes stop_codon:yes gene_type:complete